MTRNNTNGELSMTDTSMEECGLEMFNNGFTIVPVEYKQKRVIIPNWDKIERDEVVAKELIRMNPGKGVGALCKDTPFIDIDVTDPEIASKLYLKLTQILGPGFPCRTGRAPKMAIPCRNPEGMTPFTKQKSNIYREMGPGTEPSGLDAGSNPQGTAGYINFEDLNSSPEPQRSPSSQPSSPNGENKSFYSPTSQTQASNQGADQADAPEVRHAVEILAAGQMCVIAGIHPDTDQPYQWDRTPTMENMPVLTQRKIDQIFEEFNKLAEHKVDAGSWELKSTKKEIAVHQTTKPRKAPRTIYSEVEMQKHLDEIPLLDHDRWLGIGMGLHHQFEGKPIGMRLWKYYSQKYGKEYDGDEINKRYPTFNRDPKANGKTIGTVLGEKNKAIAKRNPPLTFVLPDPVREKELSDEESTNPTNPTGTTNKPKPMWYDGWYFIEHTSSFYHPLSNVVIKKDSFNFKFAREMTIAQEKGMASTYVANLGLVPSVAMMMYRPDAYTHESRIGNYENKLFVNTYNPFIPAGPIPLTCETPTPLIEYFERLIPDQQEHNLVMDFLAYTVQHPGKKINWAPVLLGIQGTGKTTILRLMQCALGQTNAKSVTAQQFISSFNTFAEGTQFNFIEEIRISGSNRFQAMDAVKELITNDSITINQKGVNPFTTKNVTNYMLATNHPDALPLDTDDRRYAIIQTDMNTSQDQFNDIYDWIHYRQYELQKWLMTYPISENFRPLDHAPKTQATLQMVGNTEDMMISQIQDLIDRDTTLLNKAMISFTALKKAMENLDSGLQFEARFSATLRSKLLSMHYSRAGQYRIGTSRPTLYAPTINLQRKLGLTKDSFNKAVEFAKAEADDGEANSETSAETEAKAPNP